MEMNMDMMTQFGLMNKISTGHQWLDVLLCFFIPYVLQKWVPQIKEFLQNLKIFKPKEEDNSVHTRKIEWSQKRYYYWGDENQDPPNNVLQQAVLCFLNQLPGLAGRLNSADVQIYNQPAPDTVDAEGKPADKDEDKEAENQVPRYGANMLPPIKQWVDLESDLKFMRDEEVNDDKPKVKKTIFNFSCVGKDGNQKIDSFVKKAFNFYREQRTKKIDRCRYMYVPIKMAGDEGNPTYKRYKLSEEKTFASFFHPEREAILKLVDDFGAKTGKFAIEGYPQKLGFLLYGPPGTGKTTFIKALAQATGRSIVNVPLARIKTNQELMDIMFDQNYAVDGVDLPIMLPFSKVIFVMEDVDAASNVVQKRTSAPNSSMLSALKEMSLQQETAKKSESSPQGEESSGGGRGRGRGGRGQGGRGAGRGDGGEAEEKSKEGEASPPSDTLEGDMGSKMMMGPSLPGMGVKDLLGSSATDELNLAGLLNVLDGVVDTVDRIIIMTTNHPEKLDPALVRPGRINKKVYMGRMCSAEALQMMRHYFGEVSSEHEAAVCEVFRNEVWSPAEIEAMCAEFDEVEQMVEGIKALAGKVAAR